MTTATSPFAHCLAELEHEVQATRRLLEAVPADQLTWKPHDKSMTLGQLAWHVATCSGGVAAMTKELTLAMEGMDFTAKQPESKADILSALDADLETAREILSNFTEAQAFEEWSMTKGGESIMTLPRIQVIRAIALNHLYHHRGQLTVYLRLLDVSLPSVYGPSADDNPFA